VVKKQGRGSEGTKSNKRGTGFIDPEDVGTVTQELTERAWVENAALNCVETGRPEEELSSGSGKFSWSCPHPWLMVLPYSP
jgi:hypothetical protein